MRPKNESRAGDDSRPALILCGDQSTTMENTIARTDGGFALTEDDLRAFLRLWVGPDLLAANGVIRVTDEESRREFGFNGHGDASGIIFPYYDWQTGRRVTCRLRRDHPEIQDGKPARKYLAPAGDRRKLFVPKTCHPLIPDKSIRCVLVESEKSALMLAGWASRRDVPIVPVALGGCWSWRGRIGRTEDSRGRRVDERGTLPDLRVFCAGRETTIVFDSNVATNSLVRKARRELAKELLAMGARTRIADVPDGGDPSRINGPDDLFAACRVANNGDEVIAALLNNAPLATEVAAAEAEAILARVSDDKENVELLREAMDVIAAVPDKLQREAMRKRLARLARSSLSARTVENGIETRSAEQEARVEAIAREMEEAALRTMELDLPKLIDDLESFFSERAHLPERAALVLAYFALNSYVYDVYDATAFLVLESAAKRCGKSTVIRLLEAVCRRPINATAMTEATLFRVIDQQQVTLLIDEAETLEGNSERAKALRTILHEAYKRGAKVLRCVGDDHEVKAFTIYTPIVFACIGGLTGPLLDRCIPIHMERRPSEKKLRSSRIRFLQRDAALLQENLKAFAVQYRGGSKAFMTVNQTWVSGLTS